MLIDSHLHIPHPNYVRSVKELLLDAQADGVEKLVSIGTSLEDSKKTLEFCSSYDNIYCTVGVYPHENLETDLKDIFEGLQALINNHQKKIVGIGECGIDISNAATGVRPLDSQIELFKLQVGLAVEHDLPIVIHNRHGDDQVYSILKKYKDNGVVVRGVMHCFASSWEFAQKMLDLGFYISFSGMITYPSRKDLAEVVKNTPLDRILVETDSPYLPPQPHRGEINEPKYVKIVAEKVAELKNLSFNQVSLATYKNTCDLFSI
ncbi:TatD family hydrolase [Patescibacteria group bacterium]|nr:TatD family hydrolase [Patescibacteria group bacterium]